MKLIKGAVVFALWFGVALVVAGAGRNVCH